MTELTLNLSQHGIRNVEEVSLKSSGASFILMKLMKNNCKMVHRDSRQEFVNFSP